MCGAACSLASDCYSFFYDIANNRCFLVDGFVTQGGGGTSVKDNVVYYSKPSVATANPCRTDVGYQEETTLNICYKKYTQEQEIPNARSICQSKGGDLATIKTSQIQTFYVNLLSPQGKDWFFGATDAGTPGSWSWFDNTPWPSFTKSESGKNCLMLSEHNTFEPESCTSRALFFVCEIVMPDRVKTYN